MRTAQAIVTFVALGSIIWHLGNLKPATKIIKTTISSQPIPTIQAVKTTISSQPIPTLASLTPTTCSTNTVGAIVLVSINQRHIWACDGSVQVYDSAVVTGMENLAADLTPIGTYKIYSKTTGLYLNGSDSTGSWHDYVNYWMPFLSNRYGVYGFHDATWRASSDFGSISPYSNQASHGCVELPLAAATWLYNWAQAGTTVIIES